MRVQIRVLAATKTRDIADKIERLLNQNQSVILAVAEHLEKYGRFKVEILGRSVVDNSDDSGAGK